MGDRCLAYAEDVLSGEIVAGPHVRDACQRHIHDLEKAHERGFYYDEQEASESIAFFEEILFLNGGQFEGKPFILLPWQAFIIGSLFGWKRDSDDCRRFRVAYIETAKGPLALDTPVATPSGWTTMGDLLPGDYVFNSNGEPTMVIEVSPIFHDRPCYRLRFSDGAEIVADSEHEWYTTALRSGNKPGPRKHGETKKGEAGKKNTQNIAETLSTKASASLHPQTKWNHRVEVAPALQLKNIDLPIMPYTLGAWLGDGDSDAARITSEDEEIISFIEADGYSMGKRNHKPGSSAFRQSFGLLNVNRCSRGHAREPGKRCLACERITDHARRNGTPRAPRVNISATEILRNMGLIGDKHIPPEYLRSGTTQRLALLQGIMDTDGHVAKNGKCEITLCRERLIYDVQQLLRSLGYKCTVNESAAKLNGVEVGRRWRIGFQAYQSQPPVRLKRKKANLKKEPPTKALSRGRMIVACDLVESVPVRCITVESDDHMFLAGRELVPTCNSGKSPLAAGIGIKGLVADNEPRAEIYAAATHKDQAKILFRDALAFYDQSPELQDRLIASGNGDNRWNLAYPAAGSFFRVISSENKGKSGPRPHICLLDEVHEHRNADVIEMLRAGFKFRTQPMSVMITNSGHDKTSVCWDYHDIGCKIAAETSQNDEFFAYVCALDEGDEPFDDETCWYKVNPSLGAGIPGLDYIRGQVTEARGMPSKESTVRRLNFCEWTEAENPWISKDVWLSCKDKDFDIEILAGRRCWGGLDLSSVNDLTAFALTFEPSVSDPFWRLKVWFWVPGIGLVQKARKDRVPYIAWRDSGFLTALDRKTIEYEFVIADIVVICQMFDVQKIAFDRWNFANFIKEKDRIGANLPEMEEFGQGFQSMGPAVKEFEKMLIDEKIKHDGNPVLTWCAANAVAVEDAAENKKLDKSRSSGRIDGVIASVMACGIIDHVVINGGNDGSLL